MNTIKAQTKNEITTNIIHYDTADFHRIKYGFLVKYGMIFNSKKRFGINVYGLDYE